MRHINVRIYWYDYFCAVTKSLCVMIFSVTTILIFMLTPSMGYCSSNLSNSDYLLFKPYIGIGAQHSLLNFSADTGNVFNHAGKQGRIFAGFLLLKRLTIEVGYEQGKSSQNNIFISEGDVYLGKVAGANAEGNYTFSHRYSTFSVDLLPQLAANARENLKLYGILGLCWQKLNLSVSQLSNAFGPINDQIVTNLHSDGIRSARRLGIGIDYQLSGHAGMRTYVVTVNSSKLGTYTANEPYTHTNRVITAKPKTCTQYGLNIYAYLW